MSNPLIDLIEKITDEKSFLTFLHALREQCDKHENCQGRYFDCAQEDHWETRSTKDFLKSAEDWASRGDFADGVHHGEPMLRRVACMLLAGKYVLPEDRPYGG